MRALGPRPVHAALPIGGVSIAAGQSVRLDLSRTSCVQRCRALMLLDYQRHCMTARLAPTILVRVGGGHPDPDSIGTDDSLIVWLL